MTVTWLNVEMSKTKQKLDSSSGRDKIKSISDLFEGINFFFSDLDQSLLSTEKLDRASPDIWPERNCMIPHMLIFFNSLWLILLGDSLEYIEQPSTAEILSHSSVVPHEMDKQDFTLIGSKQSF